MCSATGIDELSSCFASDLSLVPKSFYILCLWQISLTHRKFQNIIIDLVQVRHYV